MKINYRGLRKKQDIILKDHKGTNFIAYELLPIHTNQKSFYGKAIVIEDNYKNRYLQSYETVVAAITRDGFIKMWGSWSVTSSKHIHDFYSSMVLMVIAKKNGIN